MKRLVIVLLVLAAVPAGAEAAPWVCYSDSVVTYNATVLDPPPASNGIVGECGGLPYIVPVGYTLWLTGFTLESHPALSGSIVLCAWVGTTLTEASLLPCVQTGVGVGTTTVPLMVGIREGMRLHILLQSSQPTTSHAWYMQGQLLPATAPAP